MRSLHQGATDEQVAGEYNSFRRQAEVCRNDIDIQVEKCWKIAGVYEDPAIPASTPDPREC